MASVGLAISAAHAAAPVELPLAAAASANTLEPKLALNRSPTFSTTYLMQ